MRKAPGRAGRERGGADGGERKEEAGQAAGRVVVGQRAEMVVGSRIDGVAGGGRNRRSRAETASRWSRRAIPPSGSAAEAAPRERIEAVIGGR